MSPVGQESPAASRQEKNRERDIHRVTCSLLSPHLSQKERRRKAMGSTANRMVITSDSPEDPGIALRRSMNHVQLESPSGYSHKGTNVNRIKPCHGASLRFVEQMSV